MLDALGRSITVVVRVTPPQPATASATAPAATTVTGVRRFIGWLLGSSLRSSLPSRAAIDERRVRAEDYAAGGGPPTGPGGGPPTGPGGGPPTGPGGM